MAKKNIPLQPENFELETNTVWTFPDRGKWATPVSYTHLDVYKRQAYNRLYRDLVNRIQADGLCRESRLT